MCRCGANIEASRLFPQSVSNQQEERLLELAIYHISECWEHVR